MSDDSLTMASMNWRLVEDAKEARFRGDSMLALSLFEQSRRICINEGWRDGVHYADDMILDIYPMVKRQIDDDNKRVEEPRDKAIDRQETADLPRHQAYFHSTSRSDSTAEAGLDLDDDPTMSRRLRRMIGDGKGTSD
ncbi:MAG: hypothetical protein JW839_03355 [Candidatus Lokiarchaeota archaeon]|nr:hypothetical protein [Candidatus Lokiarchaeota archaeon]